MKNIAPSWLLQYFDYQFHSNCTPVSHFSWVKGLERSSRVTLLAALDQTTMA